MDMAGNSKLVLLFLSLYHDQGEPLKAPRIAKMGGMGLRTAYRVLADLKARGLITDDRRVRNDSKAKAGPHRGA